MASYKLFFKKSVQKDFDAVPKNQVKVKQVQSPLK